MVNVLLTCAGRRNYLVDYFRRALAGRGRILATDASPDAAALHEADRGFVLPAVTAPGYVDQLLELCRRNEVRLLFSLNDLELPVLARDRDRFLAIGAVPVVSSREVVDLCFDKWATFQYLSSIGVPVPRTYPSVEAASDALARRELTLPAVLKPRWGTASIGIEYPTTPEELRIAWRLGTLRIQQGPLAGASAADADRALLVQERLGGEEYGLDVVNDLSGRHVTTFVKRKLAMRAGETDRAITVDSPALVAIGRKIGEALQHVGNLDCDVFVERDRCAVLELNPRFGGGYPFSHFAGANLPAALLAWALGEPPDPDWLKVRAGVAAAKCDRLVPIGPAPDPGR